MTTKAARAWRFAIKVLLSASLLCILARQGAVSVSAVWDAIKRNGDKVVLGFALTFLTIFLGAWRWHILLAAQGIRLNWRRTLTLTFIGNFFNVGLPGGVGGDFMKAFYIHKETGKSYSQAMGSVFCDRMAALTSLVFLSAGALGFGIWTPRGLGNASAVAPWVFGLVAFAIVFYGNLLFVGEEYDLLLGTLSVMSERIKRIRPVLRFYREIRQVHGDGATLALVLAISIGIHLLIGISYVFFLAALGETGFSPVAVFAVFPLGLLVTTIPVAPSAIGAGHAAFWYLFRLIGSERGADLFTLRTLVGLLIGAIGALVYLRNNPNSKVHES